MMEGKSHDRGKINEIILEQALESMKIIFQKEKYQWIQMILIFLLLEA